MKLCAWLLLIVCVCCHFVVYGRADAFGFFFFMTAVTNRHKQAVNEFWSPEVWNDCTRSKTIFLQDLEILWPFPAFRQCLHALEYSLHYYMPWSTPLHYCMHWSIPYITLTSVSAVTSLPPLLYPCYRDTCNYVRTIQIIQANLISWFNLPISVKSALLCKKTWRHNHGVWGFRLRHAGAGSTLLS